VEETAKAIIKKLGPVDYTVCYQSRVGPVKWLEPQTEDTIKLASQGGRPLVIVPIAFVSDHSETLVELDQDYHEKAKTWGAPYYGRVQSLGVNAVFIEGLKAVVLKALDDKKLKRICPDTWRECLCKGVA
jgi:ferrochelatase